MGKKQIWTVWVKLQRCSEGGIGSTTGTKEVRTRTTSEGSIRKRFNNETKREGHLLRVEEEARCQSAITLLSRTNGLTQKGVHREEG